MVTNRQKISVIRNNLDADSETRRFRQMAADENANVESRQFYPYHSFSAHCSVPTLCGRKSVSVECLIDGVNALGATSDAFDTESQLIDAAELLQLTVASEMAQRTAYSMLMHQLSKRLKTLASFDISLANHGVVYKIFWILRSRGSLFMLDSVTGGMHPLRVRAGEVR